MNDCWVGSQASHAWCQFRLVLFLQAYYKKKEFFRLGVGTKPLKSQLKLTLSPLRSENAEVAVKLRWSRKNFPFALIFDIHTLCLVSWDKTVALMYNFYIASFAVFLQFCKKFPYPRSVLNPVTFKSLTTHLQIRQSSVTSASGTDFVQSQKSNQSQSTRVSVAFANEQLYTPNFRSIILAPSHPFLSTTTIFFSYGLFIFKWRF